MKKFIIRIILLVALLLPVSGCALGIGLGLAVVGGALAAGGLLLSDEKPKPKETPKKTPKKAVDEKAVEELDELF